MGFCQFVQLDEEPTEDTLWFLLDRRAAGVLPRNDKGIDLIIPIFSDADDAEVSMVLVQVNNLENDANCFLESAGAKMDPKRAFSHGNALRENSSADMIRVYLNLREQVDFSCPNRFVLSYAAPHFDEAEQEGLCDHTHEVQQDEQDEAEVMEPPPKKQKSMVKAATSTTRESVRQLNKAVVHGAATTSTVEHDSREKPAQFMYCIRSVRGCTPTTCQSAHAPISESVAERLVDLAESLWKPEEKYIQLDMDARDRDAHCPKGESKVASKEKIIHAVRRTRMSRPEFRGDSIPIPTNPNPSPRSKRKQEMV